MVEILVGPSKISHRIHHQRLCAKVPVFDKMFNGGFKESSERCAELPEDDPEAFNLFVEWLYTDRLTDFGPCNKNTKDRILTGPIKLYCFAEKYCITDLMDYTISFLINAYNLSSCLPSCAQIQYSYENTAAASPIRKFMAWTVQYVIFSQDDKGSWPSQGLTTLLVCCEDLTLDFLQLSRKLNGKTVLDPSRAEICQFHLHSKDKGCTVRGA